jgi:uncharacterized protein YutE (UPF0331/DUF86 family)
MFVFYSEFAHHSISLLVLVYPLAENEYRERSLERRASYAYLTDIIEGASRLADEMFEMVGASQQKSFGARFKQAEQLQLIPSALAEDLQQLKTLRNEVVHENPRIDASLELHCRLGKLCTAGFALFEVYRAFYKSREADDRVQAEIVNVDRDYLLAALNNPMRYRTRNPHTPSLNVADIPRAQKKLKSDEAIPSYVIDQQKIIEILRRST